MNLSVLEQMARNGDMSVDALRYLLECKGECEWLDYKQALHIDTEKELCDFARDILAIKNMGGGYVVVGVEDKTWKPVGLSFTLPYDTKLIRDQVRRATGLDLEVDIVHHDIHVPSSSGKFALVFIRSSRKRSKRRTPTLCAKDFCHTKTYGLRRGEIYVRRGDSTIRLQHDSELVDLLERLEDQADHDSMTMAGPPSPFAVHDGLYRLLEKGFLKFIGRTEVRDQLLDVVTRDPRIWIINVHGPGGVGKSALVNWAVYEFYEKRSFESIIQLTAKEATLTPAGIRPHDRSLVSLENLLDQITLTFQHDPPDDLNEKKALTTQILSAWSTLIVLDNMETVRDGRILSFVQSLPPDTRAKVLLTSRQKSRGWELPFPVKELNVDDVQEFIQIRSREMRIDFPTDHNMAERTCLASGGLPLAIQWLLGRYKIRPDIDDVLASVGQKDSPILEFSFGNIWQVLPADARAVLAIMTIFDTPPTSQQISIATEYPIDRVEKALDDLAEVTLVTRNTQVSDGSVTYVSLPITLSFARNQLGSMGDFEVRSRERYQRFADQMRLHKTEISRFESTFEKYGLESDNEKRAALLCQKGESEMFRGNLDDAEMLFKQARELAPQSAYVWAMCASHELSRNRLGKAEEMIGEACRRATKKSGALCHTIKARIHFAQRDRDGRVSALARAVEFDPDDNVIRHQYGVALSINWRHEEAIKQFTIIIDRERQAEAPSRTLLMAYKTRMINLKRLRRESEYAIDLDTVKTLFEKYPYLKANADDFAEFLSPAGAE